MTTDTRLSRPELLEVFGREARAVFEDLAVRHGLRFVPAEQGVLALESPRCRAFIRFGTGHLPDLNVTLAPPAGQAEGDQEFGLGPVLEVVAGPQAAFAPRPLQTADDVRQELERAAGLLERHTSRVLQGDFTAWPALGRMAEDAARDWKRQASGGKHAAHLWLARDAARTAYGQGDFRRAASLYESIEADLTADERQRLDLARSRQ